METFQSKSVCEDRRTKHKCLSVCLSLCPFRCDMETLEMCEEHTDAQANI